MHEQERAHTPESAELGLAVSFPSWEAQGAAVRNQEWWNKPYPLAKHDSTLKELAGKVPSRCHVPRLSIWLNAMQHTHCRHARPHECRKIARSDGRASQRLNPKAVTSGWVGLLDTTPVRSCAQPTPTPKQLHFSCDDVWVKSTGENLEPLGTET